MFYPLLIDLTGRRVLIVGGGPVAERKLDSLVEAGASVVVVSPEVTRAIRDRGNGGRIEVRERDFVEADLDGMDLAVSATGDAAVQRRVADAARSKRVWVNTVDEPALCDFIVPAVLRRGDVLIAISTSGKSPSLAAELRRKLENVVGENVERAVRVLGAVRPEVHARFSDSGERRKVFQRIVDSGILDWIAECDDEAALARVRQLIGSF